VTDEVHQTFVRGRHGSPVDWAIDTLGVLAGVVLAARWAAR
jgi:VanZ family protein